MEELITNNATSIQGSPIGQGGCLFIEVYLYDFRVTFMTLLLSCRYPMSTLRKEDQTIASVAIKSPLRSTYRVKDKSPTTFRASADALGYHRMSTCGMWAERTRHPNSFPQLAGTTGFYCTKECVYTFKRRTVVAIWA